MTRHPRFLAFYALLPACGIPAKVVLEPDTALGESTADTGEGCAPLAWYADADGDGFGAGAATTACEGPPGWSDRGDDCDDADPAVFPGAVETCNGADDDCDGVGDAGYGTWYADADADGFGDAATGEVSCEGADDRVTDATDCDDADASVRPGAEETCADGVDQDCDGLDLGCPFSGEIDLGTLTKLHAPTAGDDAGRLIDAGDATGDGVPDVLIATWGADSYAGGGYLVPGPIDGSGSLDELGYEFEGSLDLTYGAGRSIGLGDVDGDGVGDIGFGVPYVPACGFYAFLGPVTAGGRVAAPDLTILGDRGTYAGHGADLGDISGDGVADAVIGAYYTSVTAYSAGAVYVVYGPFDDDLELSRDADLALHGEGAYYYTGRHVSVGGDVNGDGLKDFLVVAMGGTDMAPPSPGIVYVLYGPGDVDDMSGADGRLFGERPYAYLGSGVAVSTGDMDGDGLDDVAAGAYYDATTRPYGGSAYVVLGPAAGDVGLDAADVIVRGAATNQYTGSAVSLGDTDGDDHADFVVGASGTETSTGAAYLFYAPVGGTLALTEADARFVGEDTIQFAGTNTLMTDLGGDGRAEILIGATGEPTGGMNAGAVYVGSSSL